MRFEKIKLYGFKDKNKIVDIKFSDAPVSIIYGDNGCGKTSFLRILNAILTKDEQLLMKENIKEIDLYISDRGEEKLIKIARKTRQVDEVDSRLIDRYCEDSKVFLQEENNYGWIDYKRSINKYDWNGYDESGINEASSILFGVNRGSGINNTVSPQQIEDFFLTIGRKYGNFERIEVRQISKHLSDYLNRGKILRSHTHFRNRKKVHEIDKKIVY